MDVDRRSLMKGLLAGGTLLTLGVPSWAFTDTPARRPKQCVLLLGGTSADDEFAKGTRAACVGMGYEELQTVKLTGGLLPGTDRIVTLLEQSRGARWIAVMDDAGAVVFQELIRTAGVRLLSTGAHACSSDGRCQIRHDWLVASPSQSVGGLLASQINERQDSFSITESFLQGPPEERPLTSWFAPGFSSYRLDGSEAIHMHCSGLSLSDGCGLVGLDTIEGWTSIPTQMGARDSITWASKNWAESLGHAVTVSALGVDSVQESCSGRVFMHQSGNRARRQPTERFVSFVMDI
jgi:hypothetical protein